MSGSLFKIGVLQADSVVEQFQPAHGNYPEMFHDLLTASADRLGIPVEVSVFDVQHDRYPQAIADCDGYVITGSKFSVYDDEPWILSLADYVRQLAEARHKTVGICFGHQMMAHVLGGETRGAVQGWGVGIHESRIIDSRWFMDGSDAHAYSLVVSHKDQVTTLPDDAELLACSDFCPNSMFVIGDHMLGLQGHPEFTPAYAKDLMVWREEILGPETFAQGITSLSDRLDRHEVAEWIVRFLVGEDSP